jgi:hypothetical protein
MDDARIRQLTEEVLAKISGSPSPEVSDLESRVAALEAAVRALARAGISAPAPPVSTTTLVVTQTSVASPAALSLVGPGSGATGQCVLEPDKPCVGSGQCRTFGH